MGMMGEHLALAVYLGNEGMESYRLMSKDRPRMDYFETQEIMLSQDCVMVSFENKAELRLREVKEVDTYCAAHGRTLRGKKAFPQFQRFRPHYFPWYVDDPDAQALLTEALEAALEVSEKLLTATPESLGFTEGDPYDRMIPLLSKEDGTYVWNEIALPPPLPVCYPSPDMLDDLALAKLAKVRKHGGEWACDLFMHVEPVSDEANDGEFVEEPKDAPFFSYIMLIVDNKSGMVLGAQISKHPEDYAEAFARTVLDVASKDGRPKRILVCNERAHAFFANLAACMDTKLVMRQHIPMMEEAMEAFLERFTGEEEEPEDEMEQLMEMLRDPRAFAEMPDAMLIQLSQIAGMDVLPDDVANRVWRECARRGMR